MSPRIELENSSNLKMSMVEMGEYSSFTARRIERYKSKINDLYSDSTLDLKLPQIHKRQEKIMTIDEYLGLKKEIHLHPNKSKKIKFRKEEKEFFVCEIRRMIFPATISFSNYEASGEFYVSFGRHRPSKDKNNYILKINNAKFDIPEDFVGCEEVYITFAPLRSFISFITLNFFSETNDDLEDKKDSKRPERYDIEYRKFTRFCDQWTLPKELIDKESLKIKKFKNSGKMSTERKNKIIASQFPEYKRMIQKLKKKQEIAKSVKVMALRSSIIDEEEIKREEISMKINQAPTPYEIYKRRMLSRKDIVETLLEHGIQISVVRFWIQTIFLLRFKNSVSNRFWVIL